MLTQACASFKRFVQAFAQKSQEMKERRAVEPSDS